MEGKGGGILRSSDWTRRDQNGRGEGKRDVGLVNPKGSQGYIEVLRTGITIGNSLRISHS